MSSKIINWILLGLVVLLIAGIIFSFFRFYPLYKENVAKIENFSSKLASLRAAMNVDSIRQYKMKKIMGIIRTNNSSLSSDKVYEIADEIYQMSLKYSNLDVDLICAVITHETAGKWEPNITSVDGAIGLMQIMPVTCYFMAQAESIPWTSAEKIASNPIYNIRMGCRFLSLLIEQYGVKGGLAAYNGGEKVASLWLRNGKDNQYLWKETREYIPAVYNLYTKYRKEGHRFIYSSS